MKLIDVVNINVQINFIIFWCKEKDNTLQGMSTGKKNIISRVHMKINL